MKFATVTTMLAVLLLSSAYAEMVELRPDRVHAGNVDLDTGRSDPLQIAVPDDAYAMRLEIRGAAADLDIVLERPDGELYALSETERFNETLFLTRIGDPPLESGVFKASVVYQYVDRPIVSGRPVDSISFSLAYEVVRIGAEETLVPGVPVTGMLRPEQGMIRTFAVEVGHDVSELRIDVFDVSGDADLFLSYGKPSADPLSADHISQSYLGQESLVVTDRSHPPLRTGTYFVTVLDQIENEAPARFSIVASTSGIPDVLLERRRPIPPPVTPLDRALVATVQVVTRTGGGSGCVVSPHGHILTSWHVIRDNAGLADEAPAIAVSIDHQAAPEELFRARVLRYSVERDLALLVVDSDLYGRPLPPGFSLPFLELGEPDALYFGDDLWFVGYPDVGGTGSRPSITLTRGIVSGFEASAFGQIIKTDGEINEGNSGGAALTGDFKLVGLPTRVVGQDAGQIAYIHPISAIPDSWWAIIDSRE